MNIWGKFGEDWIEILVSPRLLGQLGFFDHEVFVNFLRNRLHGWLSVFLGVSRKRLAKWQRSNLRRKRETRKDEGEIVQESVVPRRFDKQFALDISMGDNYAIGIFRTP